HPSARLRACWWRMNPRGWAGWAANSLPRSRRRVSAGCWRRPHASVRLAFRCPIRNRWKTFAGSAPAKSPLPPPRFAASRADPGMPSSRVRWGSTAVETSMGTTRASGAFLTRRRVLQTAVLSLPRAGVWAQGAAWTPARPVKLILPQPPGGAADRLGRALADKLEARWKQPVVMDNRPGGGVVVGTLATVRSVPDGYTMALLGSSLSINAVQRKDLPYDVLKDLTALVRVGDYTVALLAATSFPANDIKSLIALAKSQPGKLSFGSNGIGTSAQLAGEMLN